ncbi:hypothetical protein GGQ67_004840 [Rhizobium metallidurans]|uniref:Uncharacterized protein n=1 Tax=Rhizobium metallidurans TaxID=1265931 RepID=A0A7W6CZ44_9HYPH|nr:hypothetical protein [Rhizobium metallidurans]
MKVGKAGVWGFVTVWCRFARWDGGLGWLALRQAIPPSVLPDISPTRGEIGKWPAHQTNVEAAASG